MKDGLSLTEALKEVTKQIEGTYAIVAMSIKKPGLIACTRDGNPLVIGKKEGVSYVSSDIADEFIPQ